MLAFVILGLAGCVMALVAVALDWRDAIRWRRSGWRVGRTETVTMPKGG